MSEQYPPPGQGGHGGQGPGGRSPFGSPPGQSGSPYGQPSGSPYGQPSGSPYGQPTGDQYTYGQPPRPTRNGLGTAALVLGILGLLSVITVITFPVGIVLALVAIVLGVLGRARAKRGEATNGGAALAGAVLGAVALFLGIAVAVVVGLAASFFGPQIGSYNECIAQAGGSQSALEQCASDFADELRDSAGQQPS